METKTILPMFSKDFIKIEGLTIHRKNFEITIKFDSLKKLDELRPGDEIYVEIKATCLTDFFPYLHKNDWSNVEDMHFFIDEGVKDVDVDKYYMYADSLQRLIRTLMFCEDSFLERKFQEDAEAGAWQHAET